jgi:hypothetical protein
MDRIRFWLSHLVPVFVWKWLWVNASLGKWAPHAFGRIMGAGNWGRCEEPEDDRPERTQFP